MKSKAEEAAAAAEFATWAASWYCRTTAAGAETARIACSAFGVAALTEAAGAA